MTKPEYNIVSEKDLEGSKREITIEVSAETLSLYHSSVLKEVVAKAELPGFRKGKAPEKKVLEEIGDMAVLQEAAEKIINEVTYAIIIEKKFRIIGHPSIAISVLAPKNPLRFTSTLTLMPEITLPDYKKIASGINEKKSEPEEVTEKEFSEALDQLTKMIAKEQGKEHTPETPFTLTDESVKKIGNFASLEEFKKKLRNDLTEDKKRQAKERRVLEIIEAIVIETRASLPEVLIEQETEQMESEFSENLERMGMNMEAYLTRVKKTREQMMSEWRSSAEKRAKFELIFPKIARAENLSLPKEEIEREAKHLIEHQPNIEKELANLYVERALLRQKVLQFLAEQK